MEFNNLNNLQGTRDFILSVASKLFLERGFANVSIRDICEVAGVTPPTIYHYFGNKDRLFKAVIRKTLSLTDFRKAIIEAIEAEPDPEKQLGVFIHYYLTYFPRGFFNPGMFLQDSTHLADVSTEKVMSEFEVIDQLARQIIQKGIKSNAFKALDIEKVTLYLMNLLMAFVLGEVHYNQDLNPDEAAPFITNLFLYGLRHQE